MNKYFLLITKSYDQTILTKQKWLCGNKLKYFHFISIFSSDRIRLIFVYDRILLYLLVGSVLVFF